jgi:hypothetical protein
MGKPVVVTHLGAKSSFQLSKLERKRLYGVRRRIPVDSAGQACTRAALTDDGAVLITSGMTAQGWFDTDGRQVETKDIGAQNSDGAPLPMIPSTLGEPMVIEGPLPATELLDLAVSSIYCLEPEVVDDGLTASLQAGQLWRFPFNYRADFRSETGFLLANEHGYFLLVGVPIELRFLAPNVQPPPEDDAESEDDLDFEML